ncbi:hypothetical protein GCM10020256_70550 [Streptomyces thermocoprophilus]
MRAAAHGDEQVLAAGELDRPQHVGGPGAAHDESGMLVVGAVPDGACLVVLRVAGPDDGAAQR